MIGSHDTYTYLKARNWFINLLSPFWKCQTKDIQEQYSSGVRFFDIRVFWDGSLWRTAHGLAEFNEAFNSLEEICKLFDNPEILFRIWLEKGDNNYFSLECLELKDKYKGFVQAVIKKPETILFLKDTYPLIEYLNCPGNFKALCKLNPIEKYSKQHNVQITKELIDSPVVYFMDRI